MEPTRLSKVISSPSVSMNSLSDAWTGELMSSGELAGVFYLGLVGRRVLDVLGLVHLYHVSVQLLLVRASSPTNSAHYWILGHLANKDTVG